MSRQALNKPGTYRNWQDAHATVSSSEEISGTDEDEEWSDVDATMVNLKQPRGCNPGFSAKCCCHMCYVCLFLIYMIIFPLWAKWLVTSPQPVSYWQGDYPKFPRIDAVDGEFLALMNADTPTIEISPIPRSPTSCNYSCANWRGFRTSEMNFQVRLTLNDPSLGKAYAHTVYPVLLASADFKDWWVAADRRHAYPQPFWSARTQGDGEGYHFVTDQCTKPPSVSLVSAEYAGAYVLACVTWSPKAFAKLSAATELSDADLGAYCSSVGGVCGWSCGSSIPPNRLPGCSATGTIQVTSNSVAGRLTAGGQFSGIVEMQECIEGEDQPGTCDTRTVKFSDWQCHKCQFDPTQEDSDDSDDSDERRRLQGIPGLAPLPAAAPAPKAAPTPTKPAAPKGDDDDSDDKSDADDTTTADDAADDIKGPMIYTSLPRFKVKLSQTTVPSGIEVYSSPRTFVLSSSPQTPGIWKKLYMEANTKVKSPMTLEQIEVEKSKPAKEDEDENPVEVSLSAHAMLPNQLNTLEMKPTWCYGNQGPLYLVACAVNSTIYDEHFQKFVGGQMVAPPPFNDRCLAVSGRCGLACQDEQYSLSNCTADGWIKQSSLVGPIVPERNRSTPVWLFVYVLLIGFAVKTVMLCPGIFSPYPHCRRYNPELTESVRYMIVCIPSAGENKPTVLRNMVGAVGCMPKDCRCRYHVVFCDEGHRHEMKVMWQKLAALVAAIPNFGGSSYEENVLAFFHQWVDDTNKMDLGKLRDGSKADMEKDVLERMSGRNSLSKLKKEKGWSEMDPAVLTNLEAAIGVIEEDLKDKKAVKLNLHRDDVADWEPRDRKSIALRLHYLSRAKPQEDERTIKAQHVAPGTWYYKVPPNAENSQWLQLRATATEMVYGLETEELTTLNVPVRTSRGKAGGLNFTENYLSILADRPENLYGTDQDNAPCIYSICDARHQFQKDFFHTTLPYFFTENEELNEAVAFTQCPQYFHEMQDKLDYLDNNNAQFFRLNCMIRNCCGGVSSCGTNGTWMIKHQDGSLVWEQEKQRVRDQSSKRKKAQLVERRIFHESCKVEDTASSLQQVLRGRRSQFINRRLSYGMAKNPTDYLAAVQRWAEGGVVLSCQTLLGCHKGVYMVWFTLLFFLAFIISLMHLMNKTNYTLAVVEWGMIDQKSVDILMKPFVDMLQKTAKWLRNEYYVHHPGILQDYVSMTIQFIIWLISLILVLFVVYCFTEFLKLLRRRFGFKCFCIWPDEMRWWGRLLISMDNLTYFFWFWTAFFWIGFNYYSLWAKRSYHFSAEGMFTFMFIIQSLNWGMIIASSMRYTLETSMEANEVIGLSMDNIWRSTQLFYITAPLLLYSIIKGVQDFMRYQFYGEDISFWTGGDRGAMSKNLVKYWTLLLILGALAAWIYYIFVGRFKQGVLSAVTIVTLIALDVLHPCTYLWVGETKMTREEAAKMTWLQALRNRGWWERRFYSLILNETVTGLFKWLGPAYFVAFPFLILVMPYIGVNQAFMMLGSTTAR